SYTTTRKPYFFIKTSDVDKAKGLLAAEYQETESKTFQDEPASKVSVINPKDVPTIRKLFEDHDIACYEADIRFTQRYFMDNDILATIDIQGTEEKGTFTDVHFTNPRITPAETDIKPTMLSFDIETDTKAQQIYSISLYSPQVKKVLVVDNGKIPQREDTTIFSDEKSLLEAFFSEIRRLDPDVLVGWNVIDFDLAVIYKRAKNYDIPFLLGRSEQPSSLRIESSFFRDSNAQVQGRLVLDGIHLLKSSFVKLDDYRLNTAAKHFLKDTKLIQSKERFDLIDKAYFEDPELFLDYNLKDSILVYDILEVSGVYDLTIQRAKLTGLSMDRVKASIASFDSLYLRELARRGYVAATTRPQTTEEGIGGYVLSSKPGIYKNVIVLDFKSLYPSLMRTFNIDPLSYVGEESQLDAAEKKNCIIAPNGACFSREEGILPAMLEKLWNSREEARKEGNELARYAIKILMNSMYGVLASNNSRFHQRNMSNSITSFGQHFIKFTAQELKKKGYEVIYGDTDSVFVNLHTEDPVEADQIGKHIEKELNIFFKEHIKKTYDRESILELEYEKLFVRFFMPKVRGSDSGAKKRYAGKRLIKFTDKEAETKLDFTGLEFVRRDWTEVAKEFQLNLLDLIFSDKPVDEYIKHFVADIKKGTYDTLLIYRKALRKNVASYTKTTPPHVKAARLMGAIENDLITYVLTINGPEPVELQEGKLVSKKKEGELSALDYDHYIEKQIKPIANSLLETQHKKFDDVVKGTEQKGLGSFF
ncbi:MAG: DNA polymerase II, partial [Nanoarchaeota archaeon]|nr:DNA polymerase II [Nanoarchaeota archaeon]